MPSLNRFLAAVGTAALAIAGCDVAREIPQQAGAGTRACTLCHGDADRPEANALLQAAPPRGVAGSDGGAHTVHLHGSHLAGPIACGECHVVPSRADHANGTIDLSLAGLAQKGGVSPKRLPDGSCAVYCHGASLSGGPAASPAWRTGGALGCTSCHGYPPTSHAAGATDCSLCHPGTVLQTGAINVGGGLHVNGAVDVQNHASGWSDPTQHGYAAKRDLSVCRSCHGADLTGGAAGVSCDSCHGGTAWRTDCTFCHGDPTRAASKPAPPRGTQGETETTSRAVGAHQKHLSGGSFGPAVACTECHVVPTTIDHVNGAAAITFGPAARRGGATPAWNGVTCASTYCHGGTLAAGGANTAPAWTGGPAEAACGSCHGAPPPPPHSTSTDCGGCHTGYTSTSVHPASHMNGTIEATGGHPAGWADKTQHGYTANRTGFATCKGCHGTNLDGGTVGVSCTACHASAGFGAWATTCTFCHGDRAIGRPSPPVDTQGGTAASDVSVGAHASHVGTAIANPIDCTECHPARSNVITDGGHVDGDGRAEIQFGALARAGGVSPTYGRTSATSATCASTYCHGNFPGGAGTSAAPNWTSTLQVSCTSCHGAPPSTGRHGRHSGRSCGDCHPGYTSTSVNAATHVNGSKQVGNLIASWNSVTRECVGCHGADIW